MGVKTTDKEMTKGKGGNDVEGIRNGTGNEGRTQTAMERLMERTRGRSGKTGWRDMWKAAACMAVLAPLFVCVPVNATGVDIVTTGFNVIYDIISAIVTSVGALLLLWGLFEWAQALNTQDGGSQSMAFKRIASGLVAILAPQLIPLIRNAVAGGAG